jgi:hypothetical protein
MSVQSNLYQFRSIVRAGKLELGQEDLQFLNSFPISMMNVSDETFAEVLLKSLSSHPRFQTLARVCLVKRLGLANHIEVVSSANQNPHVINNMARGYSCFIDAKGSFFKMAPGNIRIFENASDIVAQFKRENRPPQRSIARIAQMGCTSGLVIPLFDNDSYLHGALFFNFTGAMPFTDNENDQFILSFLETQANTILYQIRSTLVLARSLPDSYWMGQVFQADTFRQALEKMGFSPDIRVDNRQAEKFLASPGNLAIFFGHLGLFVEQRNLQIDLRVDSLRNTVLFTILGLQVPKVIQPLLEHLAIALGLTCSFDKIGLKVNLTLESIEENNVSYSTENLNFDGNSSTTKGASLKVSSRGKNLVAKPEWELGDPDDLLHVVYISHHAESDDHNGVSAIAEQALEKNKKMGITGFLFHHGGVFIQVLEGARKNLRVLMPKIEKDKRHQNFQLVHCAKANSRIFERFDFRHDDVENVDIHFFNEILKLRQENNHKDVKRWVEIMQKAAS